MRQKICFHTYFPGGGTSPSHILPIWPSAYNRHVVRLTPLMLSPLHNFWISRCPSRIYHCIVNCWLCVPVQIEYNARVLLKFGISYWRPLYVTKMNFQQGSLLVAQDDLWMNHDYSKFEVQILFITKVTTGQE